MFWWWGLGWWGSERGGWIGLDRGFGFWADNKIGLVWRFRASVSGDLPDCMVVVPTAMVDYDRLTLYRAYSTRTLGPMNLQSFHLSPKQLIPLPQTPLLILLKSNTKKNTKLRFVPLSSFPLLIKLNFFPRHFPSCSTKYRLRPQLNRLGT